MSIKSEFIEVGVEVLVNRGQRSPQVSELKEDNLDDICNQWSISKPIIYVGGGPTSLISSLIMIQMR